MAQFTKYGLFSLLIGPFCSDFQGANGKETPCLHCLGLSIASSSFPEITQTSSIDSEMQLNTDKKLNFLKSEAISGKTNETIKKPR